MTEHWRAGRKVGRTLYIHRDGDEKGQLIGLVDTAELAEEICTAVNGIRAARALIQFWKGTTIPELRRAAEELTNLLEHGREEGEAIVRPDSEVRGEDIPPEITEAARRGYSMLGAGLVANLIAAAWPEIERRIRAEYEPPDEATCQLVEVDGGPVRISGQGAMTDADQEALTDVVRAAKRKLQAQQEAERTEHEQQIRAEISTKIRQQKTGCTAHPMPLPKPSCPTCARDGALDHAARIARGVPDVCEGDEA